MAVLQPYKNTAFYFWKFLPSQPASITFLSLFAVMTSLHVWRMWKTKSWFCAWFVLGCFCELIGFSARIVAYEYSGSLAVYIIQISFLVIAPALFAASVYMTLSRLIRSLDARVEYLSPIRPKYMTPIFVIGDLISLNVQGGMTSLIDDPKTARIGEAVIMAGLFFQCVLLLLFLTVAVFFHTRLRKTSLHTEVGIDGKWKETMKMLYGVSILILGRSVFRALEYLKGHDGYPLTHEWTLYVFEATPMLIVTMAFWWWYPGFITPRPLVASEQGEYGMELTEWGKYTRIANSPWITWLWGDLRAWNKVRG